MTEPIPSAPSLPTPEERRQRNREEVRRAIFEASRAVMCEQGVAALSLREVARRVGMRAPSLYFYFPSKAALYDALYLEAIRLYRANRELAGGGDVSFWDRLETRFRAYILFSQEHPEMFQLAFERPVPGFVPSKESLTESQRLLDGLEQSVAKGIAAGEISPDLPVSQVRDLSIALMHGLASQRLANEPETPVGSGRYGSLIPAALSMLRAAWDPQLSITVESKKT